MPVLFCMSCHCFGAQRCRTPAVVSCVQDFGLLEGGLSAASPQDLAALHNPVLDVRQLAFSIAAAVLGDRLPNDVNIYKTRYITGDGRMS